MCRHEKLSPARYIQKRERKTRSRFFVDPDIATSSNFQVDARCRKLCRCSRWNKELTLQLHSSCEAARTESSSQKVVQLQIESAGASSMFSPHARSQRRVARAALTKS
jgi:hypothetical protein